MKLTYFAALAMSSMLTVGTAAVGFQPAYANPCAASPCAAAAVNPCAANPCAADPCAAVAADPCAADPCAAANPCAADPCAADPCAAAANPCAAAGSGFKTVSSNTAGGATIVEEDGKRYLEFDENFSTETGPDLFVLLHKEATPESYSSDKFVNLGDLQSISGSQRYEIPEDIDIEDFASAVIWCREFNVTFGFAAI
ncbi:MAG: DM13 domain-containing protein [Leptolyngbyaceae cyanobacterium]